MTMHKKDASLIEELLGRLGSSWEAEKATTRFRSSFRGWRHRFAAVEPFDEVDDLIAWFQNQSVSYRQKNPVATALSLLAQEQDRGAAELLLFLFLPAFEKSLWAWSDPISPDELFAEMSAAFTEAMMTVTSETEKTSGHLIGKARAAGRSARRDEIRRIKREVSFDQIADAGVEILGIGGDPAEADDDPNRTEFDVLDQAIGAKVLTEQEADLTRARLKGIELAEIAQLVGLTYKAAAEMRRRSETRLAAWLLRRQVPARRNVPARVEIANLPALTTSHQDQQERR
jgi:hypothetical protein